MIKQIDFPNFIAPLLVSGLFIVLFLLTIWKVSGTSKEDRKHISFFSIWFSVGMLLHLQFFPLDATVADRWFYFSSVGLLVIMALAAQKIYSRVTWNQKKMIFISVLVIIVTLLSLRTMIRNTNWTNPITLYAHDLPLMRPNFSLENALAYEYFKTGNKQKALVHAERSVELYPTFVNLTNLGALYVETGRPDKGELLYQKVINDHPQYYLPYENMSLLLLKEDNIQDAKVFTRKATQTFPESRKLWFYRIIAEYQSGDIDEALKSAERYYILSKTDESYSIYARLQNDKTLDITIK